MCITLKKSYFLIWVEYNMLRPSAIFLLKYHSKIANQL